MRPVLEHRQPENLLIACGEFPHQRLKHLKVYYLIYLGGVLHLGDVVQQTRHILRLQELQRQILHYRGKPVVDPVAVAQRPQTREGHDEPVVQNILGILATRHIAAYHTEHPRRETDIEEIECILVTFQALLNQHIIIYLQVMVHTTKIAKHPKYCILPQKKSSYFTNFAQTTSQIHKQSSDYD